MQDLNWLGQIELFGERFGRGNAIEVANFIVALGIPLDEADMVRFEAKKETIKEQFPSVERTAGLQIQFGEGSGRPPPLPWRLTEYDRNGEPLWTGEFGQHIVVVSSRAYMTRDDIWPEAMKRLHTLLDCVDEYKPVRSIDYGVTDAFSAKTAARALVCSNFFVNNQHLPARLLGYDDPRWDISQGWFEHDENGESTLVRFDARGIVENDRTVFQLNNVNSCRLAKESPLQELRARDDGKFIEQTFNRFHIANKEFVRSVLNPRLLERMGLKESEDAV